MTLPRPNLFGLAAAGTAFLVTLLVLALVNRAPSPAPAVDRSGPPTAAESIRELRAAVKAQPERLAAYSLLAEAYIERPHDTGDPSYYTRAEGILERALARARGDVDAVTTMATLAAARHDFDAALALGRRARRLAPEVLRPNAVIVDALVELGRYDAARRELQRMIDLKPDVSSYARVSYFRELHGDLDGAADALRLAAGGAVGAHDGADVQVLLGNLELTRGREQPARRAYDQALRREPGNLAAQAGLARLAAAQGRLADAISRQRAVAARLPLPEHLIALGETELAAGRGADAARHFDLARARQRQEVAHGMNTDVERALFEADHGSPRRAQMLARRAWSSMPSVRSADALGWALTRAGKPERGLRFARRALRLGSKDPLFHYHAGISAQLAGRGAAARTYLSRARELNPRFSPLHAPRAARALRSLR